MHPHQRQHLVLSVKAAVAAALAWLVVQPMGGVADDYPYYGPLGAVIAVTSTVAGSVRESVQAVGAIVAGATIAVAVAFTDLPLVAELALVVALGTAVAMWPRFGNKASWIPVSALFVLIIGRNDPLEYAVAYPGLTTLGALIGIALNVAFPPLVLTPMADTVERLRGLLARQLRDVADGLTSEELPTGEDWSRRRHAIGPTTEETQRVVAHATDGRRANWRARRWDDAAEQRYQQARALQQVAYLIEDMVAVVVEQERSDRDEVALGPELRPPAVEALCRLADVLDSVEGETAAPDALRAADRAVSDLADAIRRVRERSSQDLFAAGTIVAGARRALASLVPADLRDEVPANW